MSSQSILSDCLLRLMKDVSDALKFDRQEKNEDAYRKYLECVLRASTGLLKGLHADEGHVFVTKDVEKIVKLGQQCMERVANIAYQRLEKAPKSNVQTPTSLPLSPGQGPPWSRSSSVATPTSTPITTPTTPGSKETTPVRPFGTADVAMSSSMKFSTSDSRSLSSSGSRKPGPMEMAARQNQQLLIALRKRQAQAKNRSASATLSLTLQRKMAENLAIARAQEEALAKKMKERQQRLEEQAARRFHTPVGLSEEEQQQRQVYKKVLEFEQENLWMMELRKKFEESPADLDIISELITAILSCDAHPLTLQLQQHQRKILDQISHLVEGKLDRVENIKVPLSDTVYEQSNLKLYKLTVQSVKPGTKLSQSESSLQTVEEDDSTYGSWSKSHDMSDQSAKKSKDSVDLPNVNKSDLSAKVNESVIDLETNLDSDKDLGDVCAEVKEDLEKAIVDGDKIKTRLERENQRVKSLSRQATEEYEKYNQENMDDLFDDDDENDEDNMDLDMSNEGGDEADDKIDDDEAVPDNDKTCEGEERYEPETGEEGKETEKPKTLKKNPSIENLQDKIAQLKNEAYHRYLKGISEEILTSIEKVQVLFVIVFEQLDSAEGRDQCNFLLEGYFFKPIWKYLLVLFRLANEPKEIALAYIMTENQSCTPETFAVREKLWLGPEEGSSNYPYQTVVTELLKTIQHQTMLEKLDCLVRASKQVMQCVENYYKQRGEEVPSLGADDLLPVLCYIVIRSGLPQLVSECQAMEKFIHEGYMFGEEGYCLTSFQTAINYLISESVAR